MPSAPAGDQSGELRQPKMPRRVAMSGSRQGRPARNIDDALELSDRDEIRSGIEFGSTALVALFVTPRQVELVSKWPYA